MQIRRWWWISSCLVAGCIEPTEPVQQRIALTPPIIGDTCVPPSGFYGSCSQALADTGATSGCFSILSGVPTTLVPLQCTLKRVLVMQLANDGNPAPLPDAAALDTVLDGTADFMTSSSYGRLVIAFDVAGDQSKPRENRWYEPTDHVAAEDALSLIPPTDLPRPLGDYNIATVLSTASTRSHSRACDITIGSTTVTIPCNFDFRYRDPTYGPMTNVVPHEMGHSLGLDHEHSLSSLSGTGDGSEVLSGVEIEYGGRASVMGVGGGSFDLEERVELGWLNDGVRGDGRHITAVEAASGSVSSTVTFDTLERNVDAVKGVYVPVGDGGYWIEARRDLLLSPVMRTGAIIQHSRKVRQHDLIDATPETPFAAADKDSPFDGSLPVGRTFADTEHGIYITMVSETDTSATVEVDRDPVDPNPPVIASVTRTDCTMLPGLCGIKLPPPSPLKAWRYSVSASDADGDPLSYAWRFGVGTGELATEASYLPGASVIRIEPSFAAPARAFVTVSDRKGGVATGYVDRGAYRSAWTAPAIPGLKILPLPQGQWTEDNQLVVQTDGAVTGTELLDYAWTIEGASSKWQQPIVSAAGNTETAPPCIQAELRLTDASNCGAEPTRCTAIASACVTVPLRLTFVPIGGPIPTSFNVAMSFTRAALFGTATPTITWAGSCIQTVAANQLSATTTSPSCPVTVTLEGSGATYTATITPH